MTKTSEKLHYSWCFFINTWFIHLLKTHNQAGYRQDQREISVINSLFIRTPQVMVANLMLNNVCLVLKDITALSLPASNAAYRYMKEKVVIPVLTLQQRNKQGLEIVKTDFSDPEAFKLSFAHRDDHYLLLYQQRGISKIMVDFKEVHVMDRAILLVLPGQIHYGISQLDSVAWFVAVDASWINETYRSALHRRCGDQVPVMISEGDSETLEANLNLLVQMERAEARGHFYLNTVRSLTDSLISMFASLYRGNGNTDEKASTRVSLISRQFQSLLQVSYRMMKRPSEYAAALNISSSYLNESVKLTTGHSVTHWIHQEIILEAKRMLFYSQSTIKEIAYALGFQDVTYFMRLFKKVVGKSPLTFRNEYNKSNRADRAH